jgi:hypothetical protein
MPNAHLWIQIIQHISKCTGKVRSGRGRGCDRDGHNTATAGLGSRYAKALHSTSRTSSTRQARDSERWPNQLTTYYFYSGKHLRRCGEHALHPTVRADLHVGSCKFTTLYILPSTPAMFPAGTVACVLLAWVLVKVLYKPGRAEVTILNARGSPSIPLSWFSIVVRLILSTLPRWLR